MNIWDSLRHNLDRMFGHTGNEVALRDEEEQVIRTTRANEDKRRRDSREEQDATLKAGRVRRSIARSALAQRQLADAMIKREQAAYAGEEELRSVLLAEAAKLEASAHRLMGGEIGLLQALGLDLDENGS